jgi:hypothetical protein
VTLDANETDPSQVDVVIEWVNLRAIDPTPRTYTLPARAT